MTPATTANRETNSIFQREKELTSTMSQTALQFVEKKMIISVDCARSEESDSLINTIDGVRGLVAKLKFVSQQHPHKVDKLLSKANPDSAIENSAEKLVCDIKTRLRALREMHQRTGLQNGDYAYAQALPLELAQALYSPEGKLNLALIPLLQHHFLSDTTVDVDGKPDRVDWQQQTSDLLEQIRRNDDLCRLLESPIAIHPSIEQLIALSLKISPNGTAHNREKIGERDARVLLLSTLLSSVRQGSVGNCFVICNIIWFYTVLLKKVVEDLIQLLTEGELVRVIEGKQYRFPYIENIADEELDHPLVLTGASAVAEKNGLPIWQAPGIVAVSLQYGIEDIEGASIHALAKLKRSNMTARMVIDALAEQSPYRDKFNLKALGYTAFSASTNAPLLHAYASALAAIDESQKNDYLHEKMTICWQKTFAPVWSKAHNEGKISRKVISKVNRTLLHQLRVRLQCRYDEDVKTSISADGSSTNGSFVYFECDEGGVSSGAKPITEPQQLQAYALNCINIADETFSSQLKSTKRAPYLKTLRKVRKFVDSKGELFLLSFLNNYDPEVATTVTLSGKWNRFLSFSAIGGDNVNVFAKALGVSMPRAVSVGSHSAEERFVSIVEFLRKMEAKYNYIDPDDAIDTRFMMDSDQHAFTIQAENSTILPWVQSDEPVTNLLKKWIYEPCSAVVCAILTAQQRSALEWAALSLIPDELHATFLAEVSALPQEQKIQIGNYSNALLDHICDIYRYARIDRNEMGRLAAQFSNKVLYEVLSAEQLNILQSKTVSAPDTNWQDYDQQSGQLLRIFFGFTLNPVTNKIELFQIDENKTELHAMNQAEWVDGPWNLFDCHLQSC